MLYLLLSFDYDGKGRLTIEDPRKITVQDYVFMGELGASKALVIDGMAY